MNTLALDHVNKRAEFVMSFTIPFKAVEDPTSQAKCYSPHEAVMAWREVCIKALRMRIDACMEMLFRNKDRVVGSDERGVLFKKKNGNIHHFSHASCFAMEAFIEILEEAESAGDITFDALQIQQLMKALYWIPDELKNDHQGIGFGELIDCLLCIFSNSLINEQELS